MANSQVNTSALKKHEIQLYQKYRYHSPQEEYKTVFLVHHGFAFMAFLCESTKTSHNFNLSIKYDSFFLVSHPINSIPDVTPVTPAELGNHIYDFIDSFYAQSSAFKNIESLFERRLIKIKEDYKDIPNNLANLLSRVNVDYDTLKEIIHDIMNPPTSHKSYLILTYGSKIEKKLALSNYLSQKTYSVLNIENRGKRFIDVIAKSLIHYQTK